MTLQKPLWGGSAAYTAAEDRALITELFRTAGVIDFAGLDLKVSQRAAGANMSVDIAAGAAIIEGTDAAGQGRYFANSTAVENRLVNAAPGAGTSRIDRIYARIQDTDVAGTTGLTIGYVAGTAAASPTAPALPTSAIPLARFTVLSTTTQITTAMIQDDRLQALLVGSANVHVQFSAPLQNFDTSPPDDKTFAFSAVRPAGLSSSLFFNAGTPNRLLIPWTGVWSFYMCVFTTVNGGYAYADTLYDSAGTLIGEWSAKTAQPNSVLSVPGLYLTAGSWLRVAHHNFTGATQPVSAAAGGQPRLVYHGNPG